MSDNVTTEMLTRAAAGAGSVRTIMMTSMGIVGVIVTATIGYTEVRAKPSTVEVEARIDARVSPLQKRIIPVEETLSDMSSNFERMKRVQDVQLDQSAYHQLLLLHIGERKRGPLPPKPKALTAKEMDLIKG